MSKAAKKSIWITAIALLLIGIAMWLRYISRSIDGTYGITQIRSGIYIILLSAWGVSVRNRIIQVQIRRYLLAISGLMIFWLMLRTVKYSVSMTDLRRYLWYGYYIPLLFIPLLSMWVARSLGKPQDYRIPFSKWLFYLTAGLLLLLVLTNDLHQWVFTFPDAGLSDDAYSYGPGYYVVAAWEILCAAAAMGMILLKCRLPHSRTFLCLPLIPFALSLAYCYAYVTRIRWVWVLAGDMTVAQCLMIVGIFESCIWCGLIPSNLGYEELLEVTDLPIQITDRDYRVQHASATMKEPLENRRLQQMTSDSLLLDENTLLKRHRLRWGYVFWKEDITELNKLRQRLEQTREELRDMGDVLAAENEQQAKWLKLTEENRLYDMMEKQTACQIGMLKRWLDELKETDDPGRARYLLGQVIIIGTYIKRRNNLIFIGVQQGEISIRELRLCLNESMENLTLHGVNCRISVKGEGRLSVEQAAQIYDLFEAVVEESLPTLQCILFFVDAEKTEKEIHLSVQCNEVLCHLKERFPGLMLEEEEGLSYLTWNMKKTGGEW